MISKWRTEFTPYDPKKFGLACKDPSLASQSERDMFSPKNVLKMFSRSGDKTLFERRQGIYADISHLGTMSSYADVRAAVEPINELFMLLPALEREKFDNDPMAFMDAMHLPENQDYLVKQGLVERPTKGVETPKVESVVPPNEGTVSPSS